MSLMEQDNWRQAGNGERWRHAAKGRQVESNQRHCSKDYNLCILYQLSHSCINCGQFKLSWQHLVQASAAALKSHDAVHLSFLVMLSSVRLECSSLILVSTSDLYTSVYIYKVAAGSKVTGRNFHSCF